MDTITIFGIRAILEAIQSEKPIDKVWLLKGSQSPLFEQLLALYILPMSSKTVVLPQPVLPMIASVFP